MGERQQEGAGGLWESAENPSSLPGKGVKCAGADTGWKRDFTSPMCSLAGSISTHSLFLPLCHVGLPPYSNTPIPSDHYISCPCLPGKGGCGGGGLGPCSPPIPSPGFRLSGWTHATPTWPHATPTWPFCLVASGVFPGQLGPVRVSRTERFLPGTLPSPKQL